VKTIGPTQVPVLGDTTHVDKWHGYEYQCENVPGPVYVWKMNHHTRIDQHAKKYGQRKT
jgi:hypothetical protein